MNNTDFRIERDSMGELKVPNTALYGAQTQRAITNFKISNIKMPVRMIRTLGLIKAACANANFTLGELEKHMTDAINQEALKIANGEYLEHFPIDIFQTGSGTSTNMNINEVIANLANKNAKQQFNIHPNDHVNMSQSSNDTIPTAIHVSAALAIHEQLLPALEQLINTILVKAKSLKNIVKTGRTHLMDAMPIRLDQELTTWAAQISSARDRIISCLPRLTSLSQGGTAIGTGINADPQFPALFCESLSKLTNVTFIPNKCLFEGIASQDTIVECSGHLKTLSVALMKISNDLRWMNSGPLAGISEISLKPLQPGSSIMPGKVNPVVPEAVCMVAAKVIGNDTTITIAGQSGNFQLNVMLPVIAHSIIESIEILSSSMLCLATEAIADFTVNTDKINATVAKNPIIVTALNPIIGYENGAKIAKTAYQKNMAIIDVAQEMTNLSLEELNKLLDPIALTEGGVHK
jgi:fumarate hydratase class II